MALSKKNDHPRIKRQFSVIAHSPNDVELRYGVWNPTSFTINDHSNSGQLFQIIQALNGTQSLASLAKHLGIDQTEINDVVEHLTELGVIETKPTSAFDYYLNLIAATDNSLDSNKFKPKWPIALLGESRLVTEIQNQLLPLFPSNSVNVIESVDPLIKTLDAPDEEWLYNGLLLEKTIMQFQCWQDHFLILAQNPIHPICANKLNRIAYELKIPWMHIAIDGPFLFIGPIFTGGQSHCYECFEKRIMMNIREHASYQRYKNALAKRKVIQFSAPPILSVINNVVASHASLEILNYVLTANAYTVKKSFINLFTHHGNCFS